MNSRWALPIHACCIHSSYSAVKLCKTITNEISPNHWVAVYTNVDIRKMNCTWHIEVIGVLKSTSEIKRKQSTVVKNWMLICLLIWYYLGLELLQILGAISWYAAFEITLFSSKNCLLFYENYRYLKLFAMVIFFFLKRHYYVFSKIFLYTLHSKHFTNNLTNNK